MKRRQQDAWAKHCSTEKRQQEAQAMAAQDAEARRQQVAKAKRSIAMVLTGSIYSLIYFRSVSCKCM